MFLQFFDPNNSGAVAAGFKLFTYIAGTSTKQNTWTDSTQGTPNANPIPLDANGVAAASSSSGVWLDPTLLYKFVWALANDTDPPSSPIRSVDNIQGPINLAFLTQAVLGAILYPISAAESAIGLTNADLNRTFVYGDVQRYKADPLGSADSAPAWSNAIAANVRVFDSYPGGGSYAFNSEVLISVFPREISGTISDATGTSGTRITLKTVAGAGAAAFRTAANKPCIEYDNIAVIHQTTTTAQISFRFGADARYCTLRRCVSIGAAAVASTTTGVQFDGTGTYSAFNVLDQCYITGHKYGIDLQGTCTVTDILNTDILGYTTTTPSYGLKCSNLSTYSITGGHIEGFNTANSRGIFSQGTFNRQEFIRYEVNTANWEWVRTAPNARVWGMALDELFISGGNPIYPLNDTDACMVLTGPGFGDLDTMSFGAYRGFRELGLTTPIGYGTDYTPTLGAGAGTLGSTSISYAYYSRVGGSMWIDFSFSGTLSGAATPVLTLTTPGSIFPAKSAQLAASVTNAGATAFGLAYVNTSGGVVNIGLGANGSGNFTNGTVGAAGQIKVRIIS
jgi:hypothetical protein